METTRRRSDDLLDVARALLLLQGAILAATTIESLFWGFVFPGESGAFLMSALSAVVILVARIRLRVGRTWARRTVYAVEAVVLVAAAIDIALAVMLTHSFPPVVALLTQLVLPVSVIGILRRAVRTKGTPIPTNAVARGGVS